MSPLNTLSRAFKRSFSILTGWLGAYPSTDPRRKSMEGWKPHRATANQALAANLSSLVAQGRHLERTTPMGRSVTEGWKSDLVGSGIDILPQTGDEKLDELLEEAWHIFAEHACVDGTPLWEWQAQVVSELVTAGSSVDRLVIQPERIERGLIPLAILPLEIEWLSEIAVAKIGDGMRFVRGIELDQFGVPKFYHLRHPEVYTYQTGERVPANEIIHCFERRRKQQAHGEPILAPVIERILQDDRLIRSELQGSVNCSTPPLVITSDYHPNDLDDNGDPVTDIPAGSVARLLPGEKIEALDPTRPNPLIGPFRDGLRGDIAGATRTSQYHLDRNSGRANYSSMRMDQLLTKRQLALPKNMVGRFAAGRVYEAAFPWLMLSIGRSLPTDRVKLAQIMRYEIRPDMPEYVDPQKDVDASVTAIAENLSTMEIEMASRGKDWRQVLEQRKRENELLKKLGLPIPTPNNAPADPSAQMQPTLEEAANAA